MSNEQKMLILSPHLDDAVLDCFDHILGWKQLYKVHVLTIFSAFPEQEALPETAKTYMTLSGFSDAEKFSLQRHQEDDLAMKLLETSYDRLELPDASFRCYPTYKSIFCGRLRAQDNKLIHQIEKVLANFIDYDQVVLPLGIGDHIDHLLTKKAAETMFPKDKRWYYRDYPYGIRKRRIKDRWLQRKIISQSLMSANKRTAIECYSSQLKQLFSTQVKNYIEFIYQA